jgi:hypothetical protein
MPDEDEYARQLDAEAVARARSKKPWPSPGTVRRVRVEEPGDPTMQRRLAVAANESREREGATEYE